MHKKSFILFFLIPILLSAHCSRKLIAERCTPFNPIAIKDFSIHLKDYVIPVSHAKISWVDSVKGIQHAEEIGFDSLAFNNMFNNLINDYSTNKFLYVVYINELISKTEHISLNNIKAIAVYYNMQTHYWFKLYTQDDSKYKELFPLTGKVHFVTGTSLNKIAEKIVFNNDKAGSLIYIDKLPSYAPDFKQPKTELLYKRIEQYLMSP